MVMSINTKKKLVPMSIWQSGQSCGNKPKQAAVGVLWKWCVLTATPGNKRRTPRTRNQDHTLMKLVFLCVSFINFWTTVCFVWCELSVHKGGGQPSKTQGRTFPSAVHVHPRTDDCVVRTVSGRVRQRR